MKLVLLLALPLVMSDPRHDLALRVKTRMLSSSVIGADVCASDAQKNMDLPYGDMKHITDGDVAGCCSQCYTTGYIRVCSMVLDSKPSKE